MSSKLQPSQLDCTKPILLKVGLLEERYWHWVYQPVRGQPRFFAKDWMENLSKVTWWVVPLIWLPVCLGVLAWVALVERAPLATLALWAAAGLPTWQLMEYAIHRFVFHSQVNSYWGITLHFLFHGNHHKFPFDHERLVFPPAPAALVILLVYKVLIASLARAQALSLFAGTLLGYILYDSLHYIMHNQILAQVPVVAWLRKRHTLHHYKHIDRGYGISSPLFDLVFNTNLS